MSEFNYLSEKRRYLDSIGEISAYCTGVKCEDCLLSAYHNNHNRSCGEFEFEYPEEATELIRKWAEEHPVMTNADKFKEVFGFIPYGTEALCMSDKSCDHYDCNDCEFKAWWNEEYKEPKGE